MNGVDGLPPQAGGKRARRFGGTGHGTGWGINGQVETTGGTHGAGTWAGLGSRQNWQRGTASRDGLRQRGLPPTGT